MAFEAKLSNAGLLKDAVGVISEIVNEEVTFKFGKDGIFMNAMDPANVSMVVFRLLRPAFEVYKLDDEQSVTVDMERFDQVLKQSKPSDIVAIKMDDKDNELKFMFKGESTRRFSIPLIAETKEEKKVPSLDFDASVLLRSDVLSQGVSDAEIVSDSVLFIADSKSFRTEAYTEGSGKAELNLETGDGALQELKVSAPSKARYAVDYLKKMMKGGKLADSVKIEFKTDFPLKLEFVKTDLLQLAFILAPRVESS